MNILQLLFTILVCFNFSQTSHVPGKRPLIKESREEEKENISQSEKYLIDLANRYGVVSGKKFRYKEIKNEKKVTIESRIIDTKPINALPSNTLSVEKKKKEIFNYSFFLGTTNEETWIYKEHEFPTELLEYSNVDYFHFRNGEKINIFKALDLIPSNSQTTINIFYPNICQFTEEIEELLKKVIQNNITMIKGELDVESFESFYLQILKMKSQISMESICKLHGFNEMNLFPSLKSPAQFREVVESKFLIHSKFLKNSSTLELDLRVGGTFISSEKLRTSPIKYTSLHVSVDIKTNLHFLSVALESNLITELTIEFENNFTDLGNLLGIIKNQKLTSLSLLGSPKSNVLYFSVFLIPLTATQFWRELEYLHLSNISFKIISRLFDEPMPKLKTLELTDNANYIDWSEAQNSPPIPSIKYLTVNCFNQMRTRYDFENLLRIFSTLEHFSINIVGESGELEPSQIKNKNLKELHVYCNKIRSEPKFIKYLLASSVTSVKLKTYGGSVVWKQDENDQIFYKIYY